MFHSSGQPVLALIPTFALIGALLIFIFAKRLSPKAAGKIACIASGLSFLWVIIAGASLLSNKTPDSTYHEVLWHWVNAGFVQGNVGFYLDRLSLVFALIVSGVGWLIHLYSYAYMDGDEGEKRFFAYLNLFVFSMLVLVLADNAFFMFLGWEGVGACSFLLIGHWYQKSENVVAAQKAFLVTRFGDIFLILGILVCARLAGVAFPSLGGFENVLKMESVPEFWGMSGRAVLLLGGLLLLAGATGKSAQLPLQVWLPDAMAGPTPVSALIHAATMVTAGVYLIARFHSLFVLVPELMTAVALVGLLTAFYGATCAIVQADIKRVLAYSTISQIGYMVLGLGVGAFSLGVFHFFTHAFYKALLFLAAGTVIHSLHGEQNIFNMGGLRRELPGVFWAFLAGAASLAGIPLITAGFFSKDAILWSSLTTQFGSAPIYALGLFTALLTAVYSFRLILLVFYGTPRHSHHVHKPTPLLVWPLYVLAIFAVLAGYLNVPVALGGNAWWEHFLEPVFGEREARPLVHEHSKELIATAIGGMVALIGAGFAWVLYGPRTPRIIPAPAIPAGEIQNDTPAPYHSRIANFLFRGWGMDALYMGVFVRGFKVTARLANFVDNYLVDGCIYELLALIVRALHSLVIFFQNSRVSRYALVMLFGAAAIATILITRLH
ncbi:MAG: NADH-quinone oxidoreductase subunit L [Candidatus Sumerlaea chitinivorans]|nr:NADH-quinone oxidoreductase subunit L [Candidatus Sumerlaea chitinivorans]